MLKNVFILALMALRNRKYRALTIKKRINSVFTLFLIQIPHTGITFDDRGFESLLRRYRSFLLSTASTQTEEMPIDLFMAVDEEGGDVVRISSFPQYRSVPFSTPRAAFDEGGWEGVEAFALEQVALLKELGFNLNLAPVVDVASGPDDFIYHRAFSTDVAEVAQFSEVFVSAYKDAKMGTVLKHFPGYGSNVDTHTGVAYDDRSLEALKERDLVPFQVGIANGSEAVLVAHNVMEAIDPDWPATLSPRVIAILREDMGFEGIIMTDDLVMDGLQAFATPEEAAVLAVLAGNDVLISSDFMVQIPAVLDAVEDGRISEKLIDAAVLRILKVKSEMGICRRK